MRVRWTVLALTALLAACSGTPSDLAVEASELEWAIAIHGGAGTLPTTISEGRKQALRAGLEEALGIGRSVLESGGTSLDAVEQVIRFLEDDPQFNAGRGAVFNHDGRHELDASIMDGSNLACGAVAGVTTVKNPIGLARLVMERTRHVLLAGDGADRFAAQQGVEQVDQEYFFTQRRYDHLQKILEQEEQNGEVQRRGGGTVGAVALDTHGNLAAGTSTGGLTNKMYGRVGDSPVVGAGTYAKNGTCAVSGTGTGEEFIRHGVARSISALMEYGDATLDEAAHVLVHETLRPGDGGVIAVGQDGTLVMEFNSSTMARGVANSSGRFEIAIWR
jgi:isoaspartyl peptidase/L-asparaginase-like protein (Ntn-hydrolase superfamily)